MKRSLIPIALVAILLAALVSTISPAPVRSESYTLLDRYVTNLAAGSVNGTLAEPTGGSRGVTDTNTKISIANNRLNFATGEAVNDGIWYGAVTRSPGIVLIVDITLTETTNGGAAIGFDSNTSGAINDAILFGAAGALQIIPNGGAAITVGAYTASSYSVAAVMRSAGMYWFIKGDAFSTWTMLWSTTTGSGNGYPAIISTTASGVFSVDNVRIPVTTFLPIPLVSDGFSGSVSDGQGHAESNGGAGISWTGSTWTIAGGYATNTVALETDLWDAAAAAFTSGTYAWTVYGTNTIANDTNSLKITYVNSAAGANDYFRDASDLSSNLTIGSWYYFTADAKVSAGNSVGLQISNPPDASVTFSTVTETNFASRVGTFRAKSVDTALIKASSMGAGELLWLDNTSLKPITTSSLFRTANLGTSNLVADIVLPAYALGTQSGIVIGLDNTSTPANFLIADLDGAGNAIVSQNLAGTYSTIVTAAAATWGPTYVLRVIKDGTSIRLYYNNTLIGTGTSDAGITGTLAGVFSTYSGDTLNNFVAWPRNGYNLPDTISVATATYTASNTFTVTNTPTRTYTSTSTYTPTNTFTATFTVTDTPTATFTPTFTSTNTDTPTNTSTVTDTPTITNTPTITETPTTTPLYELQRNVTIGDVFNVSTIVIVGLILLAVLIVIIALLVMRNRRTGA
jgi:hypothetical protein